ncbi:hypothetical protein F4808DRAFT_474579 [Astrocystis sublimbata]|nr:hypothetical protein F4808DRAFT_474579 [Astrocystis sublimbata]
MPPFIPSMRDLDAYRSSGTRLRFDLGNLSRSIPRRYFEQALQGLPCGHGLIIVYWPKFTPRIGREVHSGWCHVVCTGVEQKRALMNHLRGISLDRFQARICKVNRARYDLPDFARIKRIQITGQPALVAPATTSTPATISNTAPEPIPTAAPPNSPVASTASTVTDVPDDTVPETDANLDEQRKADEDTWRE